MNVTLKHLRAFVTVARHGNFTRAAEALAISQPALTTTINQIEAELAVKLFDRTTRRVRLTQVGDGFLPTAERLIADFDAAVADVRAVGDRRRGRVSVAALPSIAMHLLPRIVADYTAHYPAVSVHLHDANASGVQRRVASGAGDFGIGSRWQAEPELSFQPLFRDRFGVVCRADHPLAGSKRPLSWRALDGHPFLGLARDTGVRPVIDSIADLPETLRAPQYEVSNIATLEGMLVAGLGITALPALAMPRSLGQALVFRPLTRPVLHREICVIRRSGRSLSPPAQTMFDLIVQELPRQTTTA